MLGYGDGVSPKTFYEYIKSLRKLGIPFGRQTLRSQKRTLAYYGYSELMELAVTLSLRVYHVVPDSVLTAIIDNRPKLHRIYRRAYDQRFTGKGTPTVLDIQGSPIELRGCFLDLGIRFSGGRLVRFGPPKLLSPREALALSVHACAPLRHGFPWDSLPWRSGLQYLLWQRQSLAAVNRQNHNHAAPKNQAPRMNELWTKDRRKRPYSVALHGVHQAHLRFVSYVLRHP
jgi:hypothetical protein